MGKSQARLYVLCGYILLFALGFITGGNQLILLDVANEFGLDNTGIGILAAMQYAAMIPATLLFGGLTDRMSKKKVLCIFGTIVAVGTAIGCLAGGAVVVAVSIFIFGIGFALVNGTTAAALMETAPDKSNTFTNMSQIFLSIGSVTSPIILGRLMDNGMNWRWHFVIGALLFAVALVLFGCTKYKALIPKAPAPRQTARKKGAFGLLIFLMALSIGLYVAMESGQVYFTKPYYINELNDEANAALSLSFIWLSMIPSRLLASRIHKHKAVLVCGGFCLAAVACLLTALVRIPGVSLVWSALFGFAAGPVFPTIMSAAMDAHPAHTGHASNLLLTSAGIFGVISNVSMGAVSDAIGIGNGFFMVVAFALAGALVFFLANRRSAKISA